MSKDKDIIPKQPEVNIGTAGHVDHGKCLRIDEIILTTYGLMSGYDLLKYSKIGVPRKLTSNEWLIEGIKIPIFSYNGRQLLNLDSIIYFQRYSGELIEFETINGRKITVTPDHPLLKFEYRYHWKPASTIDTGDFIALINLANYNNVSPDRYDYYLYSEAAHLLYKRGGEPNEEIFRVIVNLPKALRDKLLRQIIDKNKSLYTERLDMDGVHRNHALHSYLVSLIPDSHLSFNSNDTKKGNEYIYFEKIKFKRRYHYEGLLFDLVVPRYHNFVAGLGGILAHNTTIIQALTGIWTSSHSEELRRGITIKIGYADMPIYELKKGEERIYWSSPEYPGFSQAHLLKVISFVDCPGHESLMANMLSGAAVMDGALLVIAANEPVPRPQTKEHAMALEILGVKNIVVVQNKVDLVTKDEAIENYKQIKDFLSTTKYYGDSPIIPVSAVQKVNLHYLVESIVKYIPTPERDYSKPSRMLIIRSFNINLPGTDYKKLKGGVIGGSIIQGKLSIGDEIEIVPGYLTRKGEKIVHEPLYTEVMSLSSQKLRLKEAYSGGLIGVQTDLDPSLTKADGLVGNVVGKPGTLPEVLYEVTMDINLFQYVVGTDEQLVVQPLVQGEPIRINIGSSVALGYISGLGKDWADIKLLRPVAAETGWRAAIARQFNGKWRLIGVGEVK
jgi:translation initiation factor 2 subunit 3